MIGKINQLTEEPSKPSRFVYIAKLMAENEQLRADYERLRADYERLRKAYGILSNWIEVQSKPNSKYRYSRCICCNSTWWDNKEEHNLGCAYLKAQKALEEK